MNTITPITSISDTLIRSYKKDENGNIILDQVSDDEIRQTVHGLELINAQSNDLMSFVHSYRTFLNIPEPDKTILSIGELFEKVRILASQETSRSQSGEMDSPLNWQLDVSDEQPEIFADEKQITQILLNLCRNAIQSMEGITEPRLLLSFGREKDGRKFIDVSDNGPGIKAEFLDQIFIPFFTTREKGSGIGLSLSKKIMQMHGGNLILLRSEPFVETSFRLEF